MKIGLDIHGVIDKYPVLFKNLTRQWNDAGHYIHIITGEEWSKASKTVRDSGVIYHEHFSIVDYHQEVGTDMWQDEKKTWWMNEETWDESKGNYVRAWGIDLHFDDSLKYAPAFPDDCMFIHVPKYNFEKILKLVLDIDMEL